MKKIINILALIIIVVLIFFISKDSEKADSIKVAGLFAQTGYASFAGEASKDGFIMAMEDAGIPENILIEDFKSETKTAITAAKKLIEVDGADVIIGPEWAEFSQIVAPLGDENKVVFISPWLSSEQDWLKSPYFFSATAGERGRIRKTVEHMVAQGVKNLALIYSENDWSYENVAIFKDEISKNTGITIALESRVSGVDYRAEVAKIKVANPDAIYAVIATGNDQGLLSKQLKDLQAPFQVYMPGSVAENGALIENFGQYVNGSIYPTVREYKNYSKFVEKYQNRFGHVPSAITAATTYDATTLVLKAIKDGARTSDDVVNYLKNTKGYEGYSNTISFDDFGMIANEDVVMKKINGKNPISLE